MQYVNSRFHLTKAGKQYVTELIKQKQVYPFQNNNWIVSDEYWRDVEMAINEVSSNALSVVAYLGNDNMILRSEKMCLEINNGKIVLFIYHDPDNQFCNWYMK